MFEPKTYNGKRFIVCMHASLVEMFVHKLASLDTMLGRRYPPLGAENESSTKLQERKS